MVSGIIIFIHVVVSILLIVIVLLQSSKGGGLSGFLSGAAESTLGVRGATTFLHKMTVALAIIFMISSLSLAYINAKRTAAVETEDTVIEEGQAGEPVSAEMPEADQEAEESDAVLPEETADADLNEEGLPAEEAADSELQTQGNATETGNIDENNGPEQDKPEEISGTPEETREPSDNN